MTEQRKSKLSSDKNDSDIKETMSRILQSSSTKNINMEHLGIRKLSSGNFIEMQMTKGQIL